MQHKELTITTAGRADVEVAVEWAAREGWNPGLHDADCYLAADAGGFLIGHLGYTPAATISVIRYDESFGFLGFYIVAPELRGRGLGLQIWKAGLEALGDRNVGLDGVVAQQDNYRRSGFTLAYRNIRYGGTTSGESPEAPRPATPEIVDLDTVPFEVVEAFDRPHFPAARSAFVRAWIGQPGCHAVGARTGGRLQGYGVARPCRSGFKVAPLYAQTPEVAEQLLQTLLARLEPGTSVFLDTPEVNPAAVAIAERHGMRPVFETARMYTRGTPDLPLDRIFGVTSFEIG